MSEHAMCGCGHSGREHAERGRRGCFFQSECKCPGFAAVLKPGTIPVRERRTLAEEWTEFERMVVPADAGGLVRRSMKMAFYGGATSITRLLYQDTDAGPDLTALDLEYVISLEKELRDFYVAMERAG